MGLGVAVQAGGVRGSCTSRVSVHAGWVWGICTSSVGLGVAVQAVWG